MKRILIIEDEPEMLRNLAMILRLEGYQPLTAENGRAGVLLAQTQKPDVILCDVMMPELDGHGVLAALRSDPDTRTIPFIFLTARGATSGLLPATASRLTRARQMPRRFRPDFSSYAPLEQAFGLTPRVAETLLWLAQGKTNGDIAQILGISEATVKKHALEIFARLGVETRSAATLLAVEALSGGGGVQEG